MSITYIYWLTRIPEFATLLITMPGIIAMFAAIAFGLCLAFDFIDMKVNNAGTVFKDDEKKFLKKAFMISSIIMLVSFTISIFIPSKDDVRLMIAKEIVTSEGIMISFPDSSDKNAD